MKKISEYMKKNSIKSRQTVYNHEKEGKIRLIKKNNKTYVVESVQNYQKKLEENIVKETLDNSNLEFKPEENLSNNVQLEKEILDLKNIILRQELDIKNKQIQLEAKDKYIEKLEKILNDEAIRYNSLLIQMSENTKTFQLLLENKNREEKKWYNFWKKK